MDKTSNRIILLFPLFILFFLSTVSSQTPAIENLEKKLATHTYADTVRVNLLNKLGYELYAINADRAKAYAQEAQKIATGLNYPEGEAAGLWITGLTARNTPKTALEYFEKALDIAERVKDQTGICNYLLAISVVQKAMGNIKASDEAIEKGLRASTALKNPAIRIKLLYNSANNLTSRGEYPQGIRKLQEVIVLSTESNNKTMLAKAQSSIATALNRQGDPLRALEYYLKGLHIYEELNDQRGICGLLVNMGSVKSEQNEQEAALKDFNRALQLSKELNDPFLISACYANIGNIYKRMHRPEALHYLQEGVRTSAGINIGLSINLLINISCIYIEQGEYDKAQENLTRALAMAQQAKIEYAHGEILRLLGTLHYNRKQYARALEYANKALQIGRKINYMELNKHIQELLSGIYADTGKFKDAYNAHVLYKQLSDSILNGKNIRQIALMESSYKYEKEIQNYELEQANQTLQIRNQRYIIFFLISATLLIIILTAQLYRSNRLKKKVLKLEVDQANSKLEYSQKEMTSATLKLIQNAESDNYCIKMLENIEKGDDEEKHKDIRSLINYYKSKSTYANWEEFETLFLEVNTGFYDKLNEHYPTLTNNERKLCVFLKLNMSNKDIAQITFQSEEALKKARLRLRKKLGLERTDNLAGVIQSL
ncbi:tetratricopeptide repeat protein [Bacteroides sp. AM10-21B]|uniref:tetratricopeptide repeat protein n=1 Tax=Bacteroides sp. AM10-21B TaxID=2292001 RepID=UPI000E4A8254|nr:tetratricopeptide repeat protein [Bacteroides sp. AM10-21B]RHJ53184.1 tetratricopeptide repeat protein [Bacteroides sp. AM10-21B]